MARSIGSRIKQSISNWRSTYGGNVASTYRDVTGTSPTIPSGGSNQARDTQGNIVSGGSGGATSGGGGGGPQPPAPQGPTQAEINKALAEESKKKGSSLSSAEVKKITKGFTVSEQVSSKISGGETIKPNLPYGQDKIIYNKGGISNAFSFGGERTTNAITYGNPPFFSKSESERLIKKGVPKTFITVQSDNPAEAVEEGAFIGGLGLRQAVNPLDPAIKTSGSTIFNIEQAYLGEEYYKTYKNIKTKFRDDPFSFQGQEGVTYSKTDTQETIGLTSSYFDNQFKNVQKIAKEKSELSFKSLPTSTRTRLNLGGFAVGIGQVGTGALEFGGTLIGNLGTQLYTKEKFENRSILGPQLKIGGDLGKVQTLPKRGSEIAGNILGTTTLIYAGSSNIIGNIKQFGAKRGLIKVAEGFSPIRIKSGIYTPKITSKTEIEGFSLELQKGGKTYTEFIGAEKGFPDLKIGVKQVSGKGGGYSFTKVSSPAYKYEFGDLTKGYTSADYFSTFTGKPTGNIGFTGTSYTTPLIQTYAFSDKATINLFANKPIKTDFAGLRDFFPNQKKAFAFTSGERVYGFERTDPFIAEFRGVRGFKSQVRGIGLRYNLPQTETTSSFTSFQGGGTKTPFSKTFGVLESPKTTFGIQGVSSLNKITLPSTTIKSSGGVIPLISNQRVISNKINVPFIKQVTRTIQKPKGQSILIQEPLIDKKFNTFDRLSLLSPTKTKQSYTNIVMQRPRFNQGITGLNKQSSIIAQVSRQSSKLNTKQRQRQVSQNQLIRPQTPFFTFNTNYTPSFGIPLFPFRLPSGSSRKKRSKSQRFKQPTKYQPSFTASALGITAKKTPKSILSGGFRLRPVIQ